MRILGIDPGNYKTGYSILEINGNNPEIISSGVIKANKKPYNLKKIYDGLKCIFEKYKPLEIALESSFFGKNPQSLIRLGEVRGVIILLGVENKISIFEYTPQQVKNAMTGYGWSDKSQVETMVERLFNIKAETSDEADAIATAFCHYLNRR